MKAIFLVVFFVSTTFANVSDLTTIDGKKFTTDKERMLVLFWATWCTECKDKMKNDLPELSKDQNLEVVTINIDTSIKRAKHFIRKRKPKVTILRDESRKLIRELEVGAVPHWAYLKKSSTGWKVIDHAVSFERERIDRVIKK